MRYLIAIIFHSIFRINYFKNKYYGFYKRIFKPFDIFQGVTIRTLYRNKIVLNLRIDDWIQQNLYFLNEYEEKEIMFVEHFLKKGDVFIDVGANIGLYSLVASKQVAEQGVVYAFEPIKRNYDNLINHIYLNNANNIIAENLAISNNQENMKLFINEQDKNNGMATAYAETYTYTESVSSTSLDLYFANKTAAPVSLIKIDIEGGEYLALLGMQHILTRDKPVLLIEINPDAPYEQRDMENLLFGLDYKKYFLDKNGLVIEQKMKEDNSYNCLFVCDNNV